MGGGGFAVWSAAQAFATRALPLRPIARLCCLALTQRPGCAPGGALTFFAPAKESKQRKAAPRQRPCTPLRFATFRANLRGREPVRRLGASGKHSGVGWLQGAQPRQGLWPCKGEPAARASKALFCSRARAADRLTTAVARQNSLCDLRSRRPDNCRESDHDANTCCAVLVRRRHLPRRRCLKGWASQAIAALGPGRASRCSPWHGEGSSAWALLGKVGMCARVRCDVPHRIPYASGGGCAVTGMCGVPRGTGSGRKRS